MLSQPLNSKFGLQMKVICDKSAKTPNLLVSMYMEILINHLHTESSQNCRDLKQGLILSIDLRSYYRMVILVKNDTKISSRPQVGMCLTKQSDVKSSAFIVISISGTVVPHTGKQDSVPPRPWCYI